MRVDQRREEKEGRSQEVRAFGQIVKRVILYEQMKVFQCNSELTH